MNLPRLQGRAGLALSVAIAAWSLAMLPLCVLADLIDGRRYS